ncbi:NtaA/DmoA family FMN-dependent monooxygenase [Staphylococcus argensis]|uniref:Nitrilotriacetate monooxygenase n=1 Tax=Staphylococcus argensis TaxID=1607738 RepID=A0A2K4FB71_9STAP|nr:NtaA/DmoA family FMN-dependent monooxygenase [Staphylococcus argensis]MCY6991710.1 NtaA/DmoA family FMN-dependent monooxygenase [Staphylococcus argensis]POA08513.1 nitrilotriacetate monooxygenase [Staphylococcus argensis]
MSSSKQMILGAQCTSYGASSSAWRNEAAAPDRLTNSDSIIESVKKAEEGKFHFIFMADHPALRDDISTSSPSSTIDPIVIASQLVHETNHIGIVLTQSTTFNYPYTVARQLKALDVLSNGRMGWNAVTTNDPRIGANYGETIAPRQERYARAHEFIQTVQALWGSFGQNAMKMDKERGIFADTSEIEPIFAQGQYVSSRGPLPIPASPQGQPVIFQAGGGAEGLELAVNYASGIYSIASDIESSRMHQAELKLMGERLGKNTEHINIFMGLIVTVGDTFEDALNKRRTMLNETVGGLEDKVMHLSQLVGLNIPYSMLHESLPEEWLAMLEAHPYQLHSQRAVNLFKQGYTVFDVLAHGVTDFHRTIIGSPIDIADEMQELFEDGGCDGFTISPDRYFDGLPDFVDKVIPELQKRGLYHTEYEGHTLRDHLNVPYQYGQN